MDICVLGLGYIGLPTAAMLAVHGTRVLGVDSNPMVVETVNQGKIHIVESSLEALVASAVASGSLRAAGQPETADVYIIAVPTPFTGLQHTPDLSYVMAAATSCAPYLHKGAVVILESTSPVGTTEQVREQLSSLRTDLVFANTSDTSEQEADIFLAYCPERVLPGKILEELISNDRVIGGISPESARKAETVYQLFVHGEIIQTDARTAEMVKLAENSFRDVSIAYANELSLLCDRFGINVWELIRIANRHPRVNILQPGPGVGGHCIAVDPWFLVDGAPDLARLIRTAREVNEDKTAFVLAKVRKAVLTLLRQGIALTDITIACLGIAFKADIDDLRESPALFITEHLAQDFGGSVSVVEPNISALPRPLQEYGCRLVSLQESLQSSILVLLVDHSLFRKTPSSGKQGQIVIDTKGIFDR